MVNKDKNNINASLTTLVIPSPKRTTERTRVKADTECNY